MLLESFEIIKMYKFILQELRKFIYFTNLIVVQEI